MLSQVYHEIKHFSKTNFKSKLLKNIYQIGPLITSVSTLLFFWFCMLLNISNTTLRGKGIH